MSSSVLKNVIQPKAHASGPMEASGAGTPPRTLRPSNSPGLSQPVNDPAGAPEDMEMVLGVLVENAPVAMAMFDRGMRYLLANRQWINEFGLQQVQPLVGRSQYEIFPGLHPGWRQVYERALQGHIVRSEHDALNGPDGQDLIYRWEVRPWRKKRDATVGGLMVICEKFSAGQRPESRQDTGDPDEAGPHDAAAPVPTMPDALDCHLPMLILDARGVIQRANLAATRQTLDKGIQEGTTCFWEVFGEARDYSALRQQTLQVLAKASNTTAQDVSALSITTRAEVSDDASVPARWLVSMLHGRDNGSPQHFMLIGLPSKVAGETITRVTFQMPPPPPVAVAPPAPAPVDTTAMEKLQDELSRARQELRTLSEAQHAFGRREGRLRHYLEAVPCGVFVLDERGTPVFQNERLAKLLGRPLEKDQTVEAWLAHACPTDEHREQVVLAWRESVWRRQLTRTVSLATADGLLKELEFHPAALPDGGLLVCIQDATENIRHEEQLRSMEAKLRTLLQGSPVAIVLTDKAGVIFEVNEHAEALLGQPKSELRRYPIDAWLDPESAAARRDALRLARTSGRQAEALGIRIKRTNGSFASAILHLANVPDAQGEAHCTIHYLQEVSEPEPAATPPSVMAPLRGSTTTTRAALMTTDANGRVKTWSPHAEALFQLSSAQAIGRPLHQFFRPSDATGFFADLSQMAAHPEHAAELPCYGPAGKCGTSRITALLLASGGFEIATVMENPGASPVFASPPPPAALRAAVPLAFQVVSPSRQRWPVVDLEREKLLLTETHHRIKNHLQIISSLLNMQINGVSDQDARDALRSSQNRVRAIASLHQHLYQVALGTGNTFGDFAHDLVSHLRECYELQPGQTSVRLEIQEGAVQPEWLMPLALTLNEALSNSFEHAFPHGRQGHVAAALTYSEASGELVISDDGIGLPTGFHPGEGNGLGLKILAVFAEQMRGQLYIQGHPDRGTEIKLRFPLVSSEG